MNTPQVTSTSLHDPFTPAVVRLVDTAGRDGPVPPREVAGYLQAGRFFWLNASAMAAVAKATAREISPGWLLAA